MKRLLVIAIAMIFALASAEIAARAAGWHPLLRRAGIGAPEWAIFDSELGWMNLPNADVPWGRGRATFLADGSRRTSLGRHDGQKLWLLLGCSYTQGFELADQDTFAWQLQSHYPNVSIRNFGTAAYGTYQSLLRFRRERNTHPEIVVYGFGDFQGYRDLATRSWMSTTGRWSPFMPPHVRVVNGQLIEAPLKWHPPFLLESHSALAHLAAESYLNHFVYPPDKGLVVAQRLILQRMRQEVEAAGAKFLVAILWIDLPERADWRQWFASEHFSVADCVTPDLPSGHPNEASSRHHTACISEGIDRLLN